MPRAAPFPVEFPHPPLHGDRHVETGLGIAGRAPRFGIAEKHQDRVADELVDGCTVFVGDLRHLGEIFIEQIGQFLRLQSLGGVREVLDVGEEDGQLLALGGDDGVAGSAENRLVDLGRQIFGNLHRYGSQEGIGFLELGVHASELHRLPPLQHREGQSERACEQQIGQQVFEREYVCRDRFRDRDRLDAAHVADLPVGFRALRVAVVAGDTPLFHNDRNGHANLPVEQRAGNRGDMGIGIPFFAKDFQCRCFESIEIVVRAAGKGHVRHETIADALVGRADHVAEFDRKRSRDRYASVDVAVFVRWRGVAVAGEDAAHDIARIVVADLRYHVVQFDGLAVQRYVGQIPQIEPDGDGKQRKREHDEQAEPDRPFQESSPDPVRPAPEAGSAGNLGVGGTVVSGHVCRSLNSSPRMPQIPVSDRAS